MLKVVAVEQSPAKVTREVSSPGQGVVLIDCQLERDEENQESLLVPLHWRAGDWSKPPIDIALDEETGRFQSLQLVLQDETVAQSTFPGIDQAVLTSETGVPVFERTLWSEDERYIDERFQPSLSWEEQHSLLVVFVPPPLRLTRTCLVGDSLVWLLNEQDEIIGFRLNQITHEERRIIRWAAPS